MKHSRLVWTAFALWAALGSVSIALACDQKTDKTSAAAASTCPSSMAAQCTAAQAAACKSANMQCPAHATSASAASAAHAGCTAGSAGCKGATAAAATAAPSANITAAATAGAVAATAAAAQAPQSAPHACRGEGLVKMAESSVHAECDGCADMAKCEEEILGAGGRVQVVPLKNGVMYVYTAESSAGVRAVQAAVSHRNERMAAWTTAGDHVHLCSECKAMRGAAASGKLNREVINIEGGCLTLMTSNDAGIVAKLHEMANATATHTKI
jgi:trimeric autotransporter adhesin